MKRTIHIIGALFILFVGYIIYAAGHGTIPEFIRFFYDFEGGDKVGHVVVLALLSLFINYALYPRKISVKKVALLFKIGIQS